MCKGHLKIGANAGCPQWVSSLWGVRIWWDCSAPCSPISSSSSNLIRYEQILSTMLTYLLILIQFDQVWADTQHHIHLSLHPHPIWSGMSRYSAPCSPISSSSSNLIRYEQILSTMLSYLFIHMHPVWSGVCRYSSPCSPTRGVPRGDARASPLPSPLHPHPVWSGVRRYSAPCSPTSSSSSSLIKCVQILSTMLTYLFILIQFDQGCADTQHHANLSHHPHPVGSGGCRYSAPCSPTSSSSSSLIRCMQILSTMLTYLTNFIQFDQVCKER